MTLSNIGKCRFLLELIYFNPSTMKVFDMQFSWLIGSTDDWFDGRQEMGLYWNVEM
jgi:hypothetical protein